MSNPIHVLRNPHGWCEEAQREARLQAADLIESQAREIECSKTDLRVEMIAHLSFTDLLEREIKELRAALVVAVDALEMSEWTTRKLEELGRMAGASEKDILMGTESVFSKALTRCKEAIGNG